MSDELENYEDLTLIEELTSRGYIVNDDTRLRDYDDWDLIKELNERGFLAICATTKFINILCQENKELLVKEFKSLRGVDIK